MKITLLHHVSLPVRDLARSHAFYERIFGFPELDHPPFRKPGAWLAITPTSQLHLNEEPLATYRPEPVINTLDRHFALTVDDFEAAISTLVACGFTENAGDGDRSRIHVTRAAAGYDRLYILDPDFNIIEINKPLAP